MLHLCKSVLCREWEKAHNDCRKALELDKTSFKVSAASSPAPE